jgi:hypothetical protein
MSFSFHRPDRGHMGPSQRISMALKLSCTAVSAHDSGGLMKMESVEKPSLIPFGSFIISGV